MNWRNRWFDVNRIEICFPFNRRSNVNWFCPVIKPHRKSHWCMKHGIHRRVHDEVPPHYCHDKPAPSRLIIRQNNCKHGWVEFDSVSFCVHLKMTKIPNNSCNGDKASQVATTCGIRSSTLYDPRSTSLVAFNCNRSSTSVRLPHRQMTNECFCLGLSITIIIPADSERNMWTLRNHLSMVFHLSSACFLSLACTHTHTLIRIQFMLHLLFTVSFDFECIVRVVILLRNASRQPSFGHQSPSNRQCEQRTDNH